MPYVGSLHVRHLVGTNLRSLRSPQFKKLQIIFCPHEHRVSAVGWEILSHLAASVEKMGGLLR